MSLVPIPRAAVAPAVALLASLLLHALVLAPWRERADRAAGVRAIRVVAVRTLPAALPLPAPPRTAAQAREPPPSRATAESTPRVGAPLAVSDTTRLRAAARAQGPNARPSVAQAAPAPPTIEGREVPVYATQPPPAATLHYEIRRGTAVGDAELRWRPADQGYELAVTGAAIAPDWTSRGGYDAAGLAPERFAVRRRGRERLAANFRRDVGRISFSGAAVEYALPGGAQDRLSWIVQLAAVLRAEPQRAQAGQHVSMWVVGAHGDAEVWTFIVQGSEALALPAGRVESALRLRRESVRPYDPEVEVWLDPQRDHLPVQLHVHVRAAASVTEMRLRAPPP